MICERDIATDDITVETTKTAIISLLLFKLTEAVAAQVVSGRMSTYFGLISTGYAWRFFSELGYKLRFCSNTFSRILNLINDAPKAKAMVLYQSFRNIVAGGAKTFDTLVEDINRHTKSSKVAMDLDQEKLQQCHKICLSKLKKR